MSTYLTNHYNIYTKKPLIEDGELPVGLENLAKEIFDKGLLRISTSSEYNFTLFPVRNGESFLSFSRREVSDAKLSKRTRGIIKQNLLPSERSNETKSINQKLSLIRKDIDKYLPIPEEHELKIARIVVQSAEPVIIANLIKENIYFFISFTGNISDLLSVSNWEGARFSQGLQTNSITEASIFASCGGHPFFDADESNNPVDGQNAIDRLSVILAQEIGHYADIIKDKQGRNVDRFSCDLGVSRPKDRVEKARQKDLLNIENILQRLNDLGLSKLYDLERLLKIQARYRKNSISYMFLALRVSLSQMSYVNKCRAEKLDFIVGLSKNNPEIGRVSKILCGDMKFNLNPDSQAYRNSNKNAEKAMFCAEALARIPQQKVKWGDDVINLFAPNMYKIYYKALMKEEYSYYKILTGKKFSIDLGRQEIPIWKRLFGNKRKIT